MSRLTFCFFFITVLSRAQLPNLSAWQEGYLDIHHINTGSGNATFFIFPDGTTMLFDAGDVDRQARLKNPNPLRIAPRLPHDSVSAGKSIVTYVKAVVPSITQIDYGVISHFHSDHFGSVTSQSKISVKGEYRLTGITEVNEYLPIKKLIDRNYPLYNFPVDIKTHHLDKISFTNYQAFIHTQMAKGVLMVEKLKVGSKTQISQNINHARYPTFLVRNIKSNVEIWSGKDDEAISVMPDTIPSKDYNENPLSLALKISYGKFDYFTGGDMTGQQGFGLPAWFDVETPTAKVVGKVDVLTLNHHGVRDASNEFFLKTLAPRVIVQQSWSSNHPGEEVLHRIISPYLYPGKRDIFASYIHEETSATYGRWLDENYLSKRGHIVIRVTQGGDEFHIFILDDTTYQLKVIKAFGPYAVE